MPGEKDPHYASPKAEVTRLPLDLAAETGHPGVGGAPGGFGVEATGGAVFAGGGVRAEELEVGQRRPQVAQAVEDDFVVDVAFEVDDEAVVPETGLGRAALELGQVDVAGAELADRIECS